MRGGSTDPGVTGGAPRININGDTPWPRDLDAVSRAKPPVPKGWRMADARVVMPLARCDGIAPSAMPGGSPRQAAIGIDSIW